MPRIVATIGWKYEPEWLIEDFKKNLAWVDDIAIVDCRERKNELWIDERELYRLQRLKAKELGAEWVLVTAPDERFENNAEEVIREAINSNQDLIFKFPVLEMYSPNEFRVDGDWGKRVQSRLYPVSPKNRFDGIKKLHNSIIPRSPYRRSLLLKTRIYHLKHIEPENRVNRRKVFEKLDPKHRYQRIGYEYLDDDSNIELFKIEQNREFYPPYTRKYIFSPPKELYQDDI